MHTRIKYTYNGPVGTSKQVFHVNGVDVIVMLYTDDFYFEIVNSDGAVLMKGGNTKNVAVLKKQAKRALIKLGY